MALEYFLQVDKLVAVIPIITLTLIAVWLIPRIFQLLKLYKTFKGFPGEKTFSYIFGNLHTSPPLHEDRIERGRKNMTEQNPYYCCFWVGPFSPIVVLYHPDTIKLVLKAPKSRHFGAVYELAVPWIGNGLISSNGHTWARSRRLLTPAFHFDILQSYVEVYNTAADTLMGKLDIAAEKGDKVNISPLITLCTLEVVLKCAMGYDLDIQNQGHHPYAQACFELTETLVRRARSPWIWPLFTFLLTSKGRKFYKNCQLVHKVAEEIIGNRKKMHAVEGPSTAQRPDFLDIMLRATDEDGNGMTTEEIRNEVDTFLFAGHDTTATSAPWILYMLASHPEYLRKVQEEVDEVLEGRGTDHIQWTDIPKLTNLALCIKETMRLYPPVPFIQRTLNEPIVLGGTEVPAGVDIAIAIIQLHKNPLVWDKPDEFQPERFLPENSKDRDSFAFMPFSAGSRNCIGQQFAINEEKVLIARIIHRYDITVAKDSPPAHRSLQAVLKAKNGIWLCLTRRHV